MKKILFVATPLAMCFTTQAQFSVATVPYPQSGWNTFTLKFTTSGDDTATNTDVIAMGAVLNGKYDVIVKLVNTKVSGTVGGSAYLEASPDSTNWFAIENWDELTPMADSATLSDGNTTHQWIVNSFPGKYLRLSSSTTGTQVSAPVGTLYYRKHD